MKFFYDFLPILLFFVTFKFFGIYYATAAAITGGVLQVGITLIRGHKVEVMQWVTLGVIVLLGGATLFLRDEMFIKWKPTVVYWLLGIGFYLSQIFGKKPIVRRMLEKTFSLPDKIWNTLNRSWVYFFLIMGSINLLVVYYCDTNTWVNFKLFGALGITTLFVVGQVYLLNPYMTASKNVPALKHKE